MNHEHSLVKSLDPAQDQVISQSGANIVLFRDENEIRLLSYYEPDECWYVTSHQSVEFGAGREVPDADFYYRGVGYLAEAWVSLCQLEQSNSLRDWHKAYDDVIPRDLQAETAENEDFFRSLAFAAPVVLFRVELDGRISYVNDHFDDLTGLTKSSILGLRWTKFFLQEDTRDITAAWERFSENPEQTFKTEVHLSDADADAEADIWFSIQVVAEWSDGKPVGFIGTMRKIEHPTGET